MICIGILLALIVNIFVPAEHWPYMFMLSVPPALVLAMGMGYLCPETPSWLARRGRTEAAKAAAVRLWGASGAEQLGSGSEEAAEARSLSLAWVMPLPLLDVRLPPLHRPLARLPTCSPGHSAARP